MQISGRQEIKKDMGLDLYLLLLYLRARFRNS